MKTLGFLSLRAGVAASAAISMTAVGLVESDARACGGCFSRPTENTIVTDHRMAFAVSPAQTVLWDQIEYTGDPKDFSWVLPVRSGAVVELSHDEWFEALDALTRPVITGPSRNCGQGGGIGCGGFSASGLSDTAVGGDNGVQVLNQSVIGPYDTVTLKSTDPNALDDWLQVNGYAIPDGIRPTIAAYVSAGFDFIALRLAPGQGVQAMQPVRVVTQGADPTLPLRMVAAGAGAQVGITLYVISEGRYEARSPFFNDVIHDSQLVWLHGDNRSNYQELSQQIMQSRGGRTWLTEFAASASLQPSPSAGPPYCGGFGTSSGGASPSSFPATLADYYLAQCQCAASATCVTQPASGGGAVQQVDGASDAEGASVDANAIDAPSDGSPFDGPAEANALSADEAGSDGALSADGAPGDASSMTAPGDANSMTSPGDGSACPDSCTGFDDLSIALVGMHPADTWITRMRSVLTVAVLSTGDLQVEAAASQTPVSNQYQASVYDDPTYSPCPSSGGCSATAARPDATEAWFIAGAFGLAGASWLRRRRR
jgi:Uncharacterized protein conserved in bacteria (DUF2330)